MIKNIYNGLGVVTLIIDYKCIKKTYNALK